MNVVHDFCHKAIVNSVQARFSEHSTTRLPEPVSGHGARAGKAARHAGLKDRLIAVAERLIEARGLHAVKARAVADAADCALGAIYTAFPDLDALVMAVSQRTLARLDLHLAPILAADAATASPEAARGQLRLLALAYLDFAAAHRSLWRALFEHRLPEDRTVPQWLTDDQTRLFARVEQVLAPLTPRLDASERALFARTLFSAVHGVVALGLEEKLAPLSQAALRNQIAEIVGTITRGIDAGAPDGAASDTTGSPSGR
jgi:AcrR family transcriptional regulator